jgi:hypothetical protein
MIFRGRGKTRLNLCVKERQLDALRIIREPNLAD